MPENTERKPVRSQRELAEVPRKRPKYNFNEAEDPEIPLYRKKIVNESKKFKNPDVRQLYILRALHSAGDKMGRILTLKELEILEKYVRGVDLDDNDLGYLKGLFSQPE